MEARKDTPGWLRQWTKTFSARHGAKLTGKYWRDHARNLRSFNYRQLGSRAFLWKGFKKAFRWVPPALVVFYLLVYLGVFGRMPGYNALKGLQHNTASEVYSADGVLLGRYYLQDRTSVKYANIAPAVVEALIATEDARFYEHRGVDVRSLARVVVKSLLLQRESSGGGSTLSQQLAKNLYPRRRYWLMSTPLTKLQEMIIARKLETLYSKEQILELYLNTVPMGGRLFGIERAAQTYFSTSARSLSVPQAAVLVGMLKANTTYNPRLYPERSLKRRNVVLRQMAKYGYLSPEKAAAYGEQPLRLRYHYQPQSQGTAPYFLAHLRGELITWCNDQQKEDGSPYNLYTDGLKIYTTLDSRMQAAAEKAVRSRMAGLQQTLEAHYRGKYPWEKDDRIMLPAMKQTRRYQALEAAGASDEEIEAAFRKPLPMPVFTYGGTRRKTMSPLDSLRHYGRFLNAGLLALEPGTGRVKAWVGGIDHQFFKYDHVRSRRQAGSTFKPFVYAAALEQGVEPCRTFPNQRITYPDYDDWSPRNADNRYGGEYKMRQALAHSVNTVSAQLIMEAGIDNTIDLAQRTGIESPLPEVPALALGAASVSLLEMVSAYASFSNEGRRVKPVYITRITDADGHTLRQYEAETEAEPALSEENAALVLELLKGVVEEGSAAGLRTRYGLRMDIAGKTGTSQNHSDGWFIGMTPDLVAGVWVGAESPLVRFDNLKLGQGAATALPVWGEFMTNLTRSSNFSAFRTSRFRAPSPTVATRLDCGEYNEEGPSRSRSGIAAFFDRLFGGNEERKEQQPRAEEDRTSSQAADGDEQREQSQQEEVRERRQAREEDDKDREEARKEDREREKKAQERLRERVKKAEERAREDAKKREEKSREREEKAREKEQKRREKEREKQKDN